MIGSVGAFDTGDEPSGPFDGVPFVAAGVFSFSFVEGIFTLF